jgi:hypothetical protein
VDSLIAVTFVLLNDKVSVKTGSNQGIDLTLIILFRKVAVVTACNSPARPTL